MAITGNNSSTETVKVFNLYTGVGKAKVLAVNPNLAELNKLGFNFNNEPEYLTVDEEGIQKLKLQFFIQSTDKEDLKTNITFFLENKDRVNKNGDKYEIINNQGQSTWAESIEAAINRTNAKGEKWFSDKGARIAKVDETGLINFLINWVNVKPGDECYLDNINALISKGDVSELKGILNMFKDNDVRVLFKVRDTGEKQYQTVDSNIFDRGFKRDNDYKVFTKYVESKTKAGYEVKDNWSYEFQTFNLKPVSPDTANSSYEEVNNIPADDLAF